MGLTLGDVDFGSGCDADRSRGSRVPVAAYPFAGAVEGGARVHPARRAQLVPGHAAAAGLHRSRQGQPASGTWTATSTSTSTTDSGSWSSATPTRRSSRRSKRRCIAGRISRSRSRRTSWLRASWRAGSISPNGASPTAAPSRRSMRSAWRAGSPIASGSSRSRRRTTATTMRCWCRSSLRSTRWATPTSRTRCP